MKRMFSAVLALCIIISAIPAATAQTPISVYLDNKQISFDVEPIIHNDRTMVPMCAIFEALGAVVSWDEETRCASAEKDGISIRLTIDRHVMYRSGEAFRLDAPPMIVNDRTLVPLRAVSEAFGAEVRWNAPLRRVDIYSDQADEVFRKELLISQISPEDEAYFRSHFNEVCYDFLGFSYPGTFLLEPERTYENILAKDPAFLASASVAWNETVMYYILVSQVCSETIIYQPPHNITDNQYYDIYLKLSQELGCSAENMLSASYSTLSDGTPILLLTFPAEDTVAKYACIAAKDDAVRYFAATSDGENKEPFLVEEVVLWEGSTADDFSFDYLVVDDVITDETSFLQSVEIALAK